MAISNKDIEKLKTILVEDYELQKLKNKAESITSFSQLKAIDKAMNLAYYELLGDAEMINTDIDKYQAVTLEEIMAYSNNIFVASNCSTLYYYTKSK